MNEDKKLAFLQNMTHLGLSHTMKTPNVPTPDGKMSHEKMLAFVSQLAKTGMQHLDAGGVAGPGTNTVTGPSNTNTTGVGGVSTALGVNNNFTAGAANIQAGTNQNQINSAYTGVQGGLTQQQGLATQTQPGVTQGLGAQNTLSTQLTNEANGVGPNPAQASLNQNTGTNIAQQAALMAGQRGAGGNAGLIAENAARQGASTQQSAIGQSATLQAQQQIAAQQEQQQLASTQVNQGATAVQGVSQQQQNEQNILQGANTSYNNAGVAMQGNLNSTNAQLSIANQNVNQGVLGGLSSGLSSISSLFAKGGLVKMDTGGNVLDAKARSQIPEKEFALAGRRYPIHDENHAKNALARVSQYGTPEEKKKVSSAVKKKYPQIGVKKMASGGDVDSSSTWQSTPSDVSNGPQAQAVAAPIASANKNGQLPTPSGQDVAKIGNWVGNAASDSGSWLNDAFTNAGEWFGGAAPEAVQGVGDAAATAGPAETTVVGGAGDAAAAVAPEAPEAVAAAYQGGKMGSKMPMVHEGYMKMMAAGGYMGPTPLVVSNQNSPQSFVGQWVNSNAEPSSGPAIQGAAPVSSSSGGQNGTAALTSGIGSLGKSIAGSGSDSSDSDFEWGADNEDSLFKGGKLAAKGGGVKAKNSTQAATVPGDSLKNDKIPAMLSQGEVVMDRATLADPGPLGKMARAVAAHIEARNKKGKKQ